MEYYFSYKKQLSLQQSFFVFFLSVLPEIAIFFISIQIASQVLSHILSIGDYSFFTNMMAQLLDSSMLLVTHIVTIYSSRLKIENIRCFERNYCKKIISGHRHLSKITKIEFRNVSFSYPYTDKKILEKINFILSDTETTVLVGKNGSGKSTLIKLLLRLYDPTCGIIFINDIDIREYIIDDLYNCIGVYFQNSRNFSFTILENIILTQDPNSASFNSIESLFEQCDATDLLSACNYDLNTYLTRIFSSNGIELSEGQHQKLAIIRTLYSDASCLVLDEPSSSLDPEAEHKIFDTMRRITSNKLTLLTSHRLTNIAPSDHILVLEQGHIIENGSIQDLLHREDSRFVELFEFQSQRFKNFHSEEGL